MPDERGTLRRIDWQELCPWLLILKSFRLAAGMRILALTLSALIVSSVGWNAVGWVFSKAAESDQVLYRWIERDTIWPIQSSWPALNGSSGRSGLGPDVFNPGRHEPIFKTWEHLSDPFQRIFSLEVTFVQLAYLVLGCSWSLVVWALFGGAITRIAAVAFAREDRLGLIASLDFARRKWFSFLAGPLFPFVGVLMAVLPLFLLGLLMRASFFLLFSFILWPIVLLAGFFLAIVTLGLLFGWPLMWGTISSEGTDAFDALSRSYNYIRERPLYYLGYTLAAALFGAICAALVNVFAETIVHLSYWGISWGYGTENLQTLRAAGDDAGWFVRFGGGTIGFFNGCLLALVTAFSFGFFWTAMTAVYLLMRLKVDATELDEVYLPDEEQTFGMPPLTTDASNVPQVADTPASDPGMGPTQ